MFMVKNEITNIKNLLSLRLKTQVRGLMWVLVLLTLFMFVPFIGTIVGIVGGYGINFYNRGDFSVTLFVGIVVGFFVQMLTYKNTNDRLTVYPQTNSSRFISSLLHNFINVFIFLLPVLVSYLIQYLIVFLMTILMDDVHLALDFSFSLVIIGFFVTLAYYLLIVATIGLVGVFLRKWTYCTVAVFTVALSLLISNFSAGLYKISNVLAFLTRESSLFLFFAKAIVLLIAIITIAVVVNRYTVYFKDHGRKISKAIVIGCIVVTAFVVTMAINFSNPPTTSTTQSMAWIEPEDSQLEDFTREGEIHIDISHIPNGSNIEIIVEDRYVFASVSAGAMFMSSTSLFINSESPLYNIQGDTLIIRYRPPFFDVDGIYLMDFANSQMVASLEGNILVLDFIIDDTHIVILPVWGTARQFDFFSDMNIFRQSLTGFSAGGGITTSVWVRVE